MRQHFESFYVTQGLPGLPYRLYLSEEKNIAEKTLNHHQLVVSSQEKLTNYSTELKWLLSYLPKRNVLLEKTSSSRPSSSEENHQLQTLVEEKLTQTQQIGQSILNSICTFDITTIGYNQLDALSNEQLALINNVISLVRNMQLFFLGYHSSAFVTMNKEQLAEVEEGLKSKIQELDQDAFLNSDVTLNSEIKDCYLAAQTLLENSKAELLLMETSSSRETGLAATKNIINISEAAQKIEEAKTATESEIEESDHKEALGNEIIKMEALHFLLLNAILSYRAIEDESWIEKKCGNLNKLYDQITATIPTITQQANALTNLNIEHLSTRLRDLLDAKNFKLDKPLEVPQGPLEFLDELSSLDNDLLQKRIIGTHGKIALDDAPDTSIAKSDVTYTDQTRREWTSGINLIRLAICRTYGIQVKNIFDSRFFVKRREENSLKVREVINFLFHKNHEPKYHSSFFIDPKMSHEDFLKMLSAVHHNSNIASNKVIKIDQATLDFNPFSKKPLDLPNESISAADLRQREAAFQYTRQALEKAFPEMFLTKEQMNEVLEKFDAQFKVIPKGILLSLEKAHAFIEREREILKARSYWKKYVMRYLGQEAMQNMLNGLYYSIGAHLLPFALGILSYLYYLSVTHNLS